MKTKFELNPILFSNKSELDTRKDPFLDVERKDVTTSGNREQKCYTYAIPEYKQKNKLYSMQQLLDLWQKIEEIIVKNLPPSDKKDNKQAGKANMHDEIVRTAKTQQKREHKNIDIDGQVIRDDPIDNLIHDTSKDKESDIVEKSGLPNKNLSQAIEVMIKREIQAQRHDLLSEGRSQLHRLKQFQGDHAKELYHDLFFL